MFVISAVVGTSRPARAAALLRAISIRFIQPGRRAKIAKKISTMLRSERLRGAVGVTKISAFDQVLAQCAMAGHIAFYNTHDRPPGNGLLVVSRNDSSLFAKSFSM